VEANSRTVFQTQTIVLYLLISSSIFFYLLFCQIPLVGTTEVQLVTILLSFYAAKDRTEFRQFYLADACQLVEHLLLLEFQLLLVGQILPLATTADTKVLTKGRRAYITIFYKAHHLALGKGVFLTSNLYVAHVARHTKGYENHQVLPMEQALALGCHSLYLDALKER